MKKMTITFEVMVGTRTSLRGYGIGTALLAITYVLYMCFTYD